MLKNRKIRFGLAWQLVTILSLLVIVSGMLNSWLAYQNSKKQLQAALGNQLLSLVNSTATFINGDQHDNVVRVDAEFVDGWEDFEFIRAQLQQVKHANDLQISAHGSPIYTLRKSADFASSQMLEFVIMTDPDEQGNFFIGNQIPAEPHHLEALAGAAITTGLYQDDEGIWISAAAPVYNSSKQIVGLLQADRHVSFFYAEATALAKQLFFGSTIIILIAVSIGIAYARYLVSGINKIIAAAKRFGSGDYGKPIKIQRHDEIGFLASVFNKMSLRINKARVYELKQKLMLKKLSKALANANKGLEAKVEKRTAQLRDSHGKLEETLKSLQQSQASLVQSEKMASLGQLAAGVAHEINNPMAFVTSNMATLKEYTDNIMGVIDKVTPIVKAANQEDNPLLQQAVQDYMHAYSSADMEFLGEDIVTLLDESLEGANRVKDIVANLKNYSRVDAEEFSVANINDCLESTLKITHNETKYNCEVIKDYGELPDIECNPGKLNQVFTNLIVNAAQSMDEDGKLTITTTATQKDIVIKVADTGKGIPKENLDKIFDAFFTTKVVGEGTGLGLYISYGIIQEHDGDMDVTSEVGKGTVFTITLPIYKRSKHAA